MSGAAIFTFASAQEGKRVTVDAPAAIKQNSRPEPTPQASPLTERPASSSSVRYAYEFTQPQFYIRHIVIEHDSAGRGKITFERQNEDSPIEEPVNLSDAVRERILSLWAALKFLESDTNYQSDKQFPHLGTMQLRMEQNDRKRTAEFNWTHNDDASALVTEYRHVADQAILIFDISVARENQPLNAPKLMDQLESLLTRGGLSDPRQLVPLLKEVSTDEHLPLIARNHALRILKKMEK